MVLEHSNFGRSERGSPTDVTEIIDVLTRAARCLTPMVIEAGGRLPLAPPVLEG